jgi:hypothetical protein
MATLFLSWLDWSVAEISGEGAAAPTFVENDEFSEILTYKRAKNSLFECKWGGVVCRKFESFVGNLEGFAPPPHRKK